jgi:programmed cell death 6-interacting protein
MFFFFRYCDQLTALEGTIPAQDVQIPFKWKDAFDKGSLFTGKMSLSEFKIVLSFFLFDN